MPLYKVGEYRFILSGQSVLERALKRFTVSEIDFELITKEDKITPSTMVTFSKLANEFTNAGRFLRHSQLLLPFWILTGFLSSSSNRALKFGAIERTVFLLIPLGLAARPRLN